VADEVARHVREGADHPALKWAPGRRVFRLAIGVVIPAEGFRQTVAGRRKRFRAALAARLPDWRGVAGRWARADV
jgi:hypothetical protein